MSYISLELVVDTVALTKIRHALKGLPGHNWTRTALSRTTNRGGKLLLPLPLMHFHSRTLISGTSRAAIDLG
jgi:hypothetical protein